MFFYRNLFTHMKRIIVYLSGFITRCWNHLRKTQLKIKTIKNSDMLIRQVIVVFFLTLIIEPP